MNALNGKQIIVFSEMCGNCFKKFFKKYLSKNIFISENKKANIYIQTS